MRFFTAHASLPSHSIPVDPAHLVLFFSHYHSKRGKTLNAFLFTADFSLLLPAKKRVGSVQLAGQGRKESRKKCPGLRFIRAKR